MCARWSLSGHFDSKHARHSIYSADIQPRPLFVSAADQPLRLATAGGDGSVKIWDISKLEVDAQDILLASLDQHSKSVNIVRWSSDGTLLASGSDDTYVIVYRLLKNGAPSSNFGTKSRKNKENWMRYYTMRGHTMDVLDLDWSPRNFIASGSIDNKVIIWSDVEANLSSAVMRTPFKVLSAHKSFVKGVAFDPTGRYLSSCCSENIVIIWDALEWVQVKSLPGLLGLGADRTIFRRMSWAPDGNSLCVSSALKSEKPVGLVIKRGTWESVADLVGHETQSCCSRFFPHVLSTGSSTRGPPLCAVALGDQSGLVSFWSSDKKTPLLVLRDCFERSVTDLSWTVSGGRRVAAMSSLDGSVAFVSFYGDAIQCMSKEQLDQHFLKLYGESVETMRSAPEALIENPDIFKYLPATRTEDAAINLPSAAMPTSFQTQNPLLASDKSILDQQEVTVNKAGKKRIRPVLDYVEAATDPSMVSVPPAHVPQVFLHQSSTTIGNSTEIDSDRSAPVLNGVSSAASPLTERNLESNIGLTHGTRPYVNGVGRTNRTNSLNLSERQGGLLQLSFEVDKVVHSIQRTAVDQSKFLVLEMGDSVSSGGTRESFGRRNQFILHAKLISPPSLLLSQRSQSSLLTIVSLCDGTVDNPIWTTVVVGEMTSLGCSPSNSNHGGVCLIGCLDGSLHILSINAGTRLFPPLLLGLAVAHVDVNVDLGTIRLLAVTVDGEIWAWKLGTVEIGIEVRTSVKPLMQSMRCRTQEDTQQSNKKIKIDATLVDCCFSAEGFVIASVLSKGATGGDLQSFTYCSQIMAWSRLSDIRHVMSSSFVTSALSSSRATPTSHLEVLQEAAIRKGGLSAGEVLSISRSRILAPSAELRKYEGYITVSHIEEKISGAFMMNSCIDAKYWIREWVQTCSNSKALEVRLRLLIDNLFRPHSSEESLFVSDRTNSMVQFMSGKFASILGLTRENWLKEVIMPVLVQSNGNATLFSELNEVILAQSFS